MNVNANGGYFLDSNLLFTRFVKTLPTNMLCYQALFSFDACCLFQISNIISSLLFSFLALGRGLIQEMPATIRTGIIN